MDNLTTIRKIPFARGLLVVAFAISLLLLIIPISAQKFHLLIQSISPDQGKYTVKGHNLILQETLACYFLFPNFTELKLFVCKVDRQFKQIVDLKKLDHEQ